MTGIVFGGLLLAQQPHRLEAGLLRHHDVHEDQVGLLGGRDVERLLAVLRNQELVAGAAQDHAVQGERGQRIVGEQNAFVGHVRPYAW